MPWFHFFNLTFLINFVKNVGMAYAEENEAKKRCKEITKLLLIYIAAFIIIMIFYPMYCIILSFASPNLFNSEFLKIRWLEKRYE